MSRDKQSEKQQDRPGIIARVRNWVNVHRDASDEALALIAAIGKALLDRRVTVLDRANIVRKAEALIRALNSSEAEE